MMMDSKFNLLKLLADDTASSLSKDSEEKVSKFLLKLGLFPPLQEVDDERREWTYAKGMVGIWEPRFINGQVAYERSERFQHEWIHWADVSHITPKGKKKRIVFIGESVARGYFYDPLFTPTLVLQTMLQLCNVPQGVEVIDLARNNLWFKNDLLLLIDSARMLEPDVFVIFSGNNLALEKNMLKQRGIAVMLRKSGGIPAIKTYFEALMEKEVERIAKRLKTLQIPTVFIIPEFNQQA